MSIKALLERFGSAIARRNPKLSKALRPGLAEDVVRRNLKRAGVTGMVEPVVSLFAWHDGSEVDPSFTVEEASPFPMSPFMFVDFEMSLAHFQGFAEGALYHPRMGELVGRCFPVFWDGSDNWMAADISPEGRGRVVLIVVQDEKPARKIFDSFEDFLEEAIRANDENDGLEYEIRAS